MSEAQYDFGMIGLGTMGHALLLNMADHGFGVAGYDTDPKKVEAIGEGGRIAGFSDMAAFVRSIRKPRAIMMLVPAGGPVDSVIAGIRPLLEPGDFLIDGGNSFYKDTDRREKELRGAGFGFIGMGVSGGEAGARSGPSMMPGGTPENYERIRPIVEAVAAKYDGEPCVALMGAGSAGHYVKTVHNGIEYAMMQLIAEAYDFTRTALGHTNQEIADGFGKWNEGDLGGFLIEITSTVLRYQDPETGRDLVDLISDKAKSKGTGKWTSQDAMDLGYPIPTIDASVNAREISGLKPERVKAEELYGAYEAAKPSADARCIHRQDLAAALRLSFLLAYAQGLGQIKVASEEYDFGTDLQAVARVWRAGCIIRSKLLEPIRAALAEDPALPNLLLASSIKALVDADEPGLRATVIRMQEARIPVPALSASLAYLDGYRRAWLPANLIQAQRDFFGAHTYERLDKPGTFHTRWDQA